MELNPRDFHLERTSIWSFPNRGNWATHNGKYRGNWSPYVPRNLILRYSQVGDLVLDQFAGSGTTLIEAKLLNRNCLGVDINPQNKELISKNLAFPNKNEAKVYFHQGDALNLNFIPDNSIDFICTHPPYANIIKYSNSKGDLSLLPIDDFLEALSKLATECQRVLKTGRYCAIMIGDIRKHKKVIPLGFHLLNAFMSKFDLQEIIIKKQHNARGTKNWADKRLNFYLLAHEYIFVFQTK